MTTIAPFAAGSYATTRTATQLTALKSQLTDLSSQLGSGLTAQSYGGLGTGRSSALSAQASISTLNGYSAVIGIAQTRAKLATTGLTEVVTVGTATNTALQNGLQSSTETGQAAKATALDNLNAALDALNQTDGSVYLFGGRDGVSAPVLDASTILNGTTDADGNTLAGLSTLVNDQVSADLGAGKNGRMTQSAVAGTAFSLTEDAKATAMAPSGPFGFSLSTMTASNPTAVQVTAGTGNPASAGVNVAAQPSAGDTLSIRLGMPDGSFTTVTLTASTVSGSTSATAFEIGADTATTAANLSKAVSSALQQAAGSTLTANATARVSKDFFAASSQQGVYPQRVTDPTGQPSYRAGTATDTVAWYRGENSPSDARSTQTFQIGSSATVQLGARANEGPIRSVLAGLATVAIGMPSGTTTPGAYAAVADQATPLLAAASKSPSVQDIVTDFSLASARMTTAASTNNAQKNTLQDTVDAIEQPSTEEVAAKLLDLQTRLQASYQITSSLSKLSLVNYLS